MTEAFWRQPRETHVVRICILVVACALLVSATLVGTTRGAGAAPNLDAAGVALTPAGSGLASPVALAWRHGDARIYVADQGGSVRIVNTNGTLVSTPVLTLTVSSGNEQGLLGLTFSSSGTKLYVDYTDSSGDIHIVEYTMSGDVANGGTRRELLFVAHHTHANHNGGEVIFGPDGDLYIGLGDGGGGGDPDGNAQNLNALLGKILRIDPAPSGGLQYTIPADNPFRGQSGKRGEIWMYGLRNPWRFSFDRSDDSLWIGDVGQDLYEEVDHAAAGQKGTNWGWPLREGTHPYNGGARPAGAQDPLFDVSHNDGSCAIIGGYVYRGTAIPDLTGAYVFGDSCRSPLVGVVQSGGQVIQHRDLGVSVSDLSTFGEDPTGELYAVSRSGTLYKLTPGTRPIGYWIAGADGRVWGYHGVTSCNSSHPSGSLAVVGITGTSTGYWTDAYAGAVRACHLPSYGSMAGQHLNRPIVGMAATPSEHGYWLVASDGGIFSFGDARFRGSTGGHRLNKPVVGMAATPSGRGYWLVASDGGIFSFGDARFYGSTGGQTINKPVVGMASTSSGHGYWLVASDGGIFSFGDARFRGSTGGQHLTTLITGMAPTPSGNGYWLIAANGNLFTFGDAPYLGSPSGAGPHAVGVAHN